MRLLGRELRGLYLADPLVPPWGRSSSVTGVATDRNSALGISAVWACVRLLTSAVSRMPVDTLIGIGGDARPYQPPRWMRHPIMGNPNFGRIQHLEQVMMSLLFEGNFFTLTVRDNSNDVSEIYNLDPRDIEITGSVSAPGYKMRTRNGVVEYGPDEVMHRPLMTMPGSQRGVSPIEAARLVYGVGLASQEYAARFFTQDATPPAYISVPQGSKVDAKQLKTDWEEAHAGPDNWHSVGVLTGGGELKTLTLTHEQAEFIDQRRFSVEEIARWFGIPPHLLGAVDRTTSWGSGIEEQGLAFIAYSLNDYLVLIEDAYAQLVPNPLSYIRFNRNALLRGDAKARGEFYSQMFAVGAMNPDEIRGKEDLPPLPDGDGQEYFVPANFQTIDRALNMPDATPPVPPDMPDMPMTEPPPPTRSVEDLIGASETRMYAALERSVAPVTFADGAFRIDPSIIVHTPEQVAPIVNVTVPEREPAQVTFADGAFRTDVTSPDITVNIPEQPAPVVTFEEGAIAVSTPDVTVEGSQITVAAPQVTVEPPDVTVIVPEPRSVTKTIKRNARGEITTIVEE